MQHAVCRGRLSYYSTVSETYSNSAHCTTGILLWSGERRCWAMGVAATVHQSHDVTILASRWATELANLSTYKWGEDAPATSSRPAARAPSMFCCSSWMSARSISLAAAISRMHCFLSLAVRSFCNRLVAEMTPAAACLNCHCP